jgi:hypothetical protein
MLAEIIIGVLAVTLPMVGVYFGVPWRVAMVVPALALFAIGYLSGTPETFDPPVRQLVWVIPALMTYLSMLVFGHMVRVTLEMHGLRW